MPSTVVGPENTAINKALASQSLHSGVGKQKINKEIHSIKTAVEKNKEGKGKGSITLQREGVGVMDGLTER